MNPVKFIKVMVSNPMNIWQKVEDDSATPLRILMHFVLAILPVGVALFYFFTLFPEDGGGQKEREGSILLCTHYVLSSLLTLLAAAYAVDLLAPLFSAERNFSRSFQLVAYSSFLLLVSSAFDLSLGRSGYSFILIAFTILVLYSRAFDVLVKIPDDRKTGYKLASSLAVASLYIALPLLTRWVMSSLFGVAITGKRLRL